MVVVFLQTLLNLLHREISSMDGHDVVQEEMGSDEEDDADTAVAQAGLENDEDGA
jgi:hypothetical protein